jgi:hypothetical protein
LRPGAHLVPPPDQRLLLALRIVGLRHGPVIPELPHQRGVLPQLESAALAEDKDATAAAMDAAIAAASGWNRDGTVVPLAADRRS